MVLLYNRTKDSYFVKINMDSSKLWDKEFTAKKTMKRESNEMFVAFSEVFEIMWGLTRDDENE